MARSGGAKSPPHHVHQPTHLYEARHQWTAPLLRKQLQRFQVESGARHQTRVLERHRSICVGEIFPWTCHGQREAWRCGWHLRPHDLKDRTNGLAGLKCVGDWLGAGCAHLDLARGVLFLLLCCSRGRRRGCRSGASSSSSRYHLLSQ